MIKQSYLLFILKIILFSFSIYLYIYASGKMNFKNPITQQKYLDWVKKHGKNLKKYISILILMVIISNILGWLSK